MSPEIPQPIPSSANEKETKAEAFLPVQKKLADQEAVKNNTTPQLKELRATVADQELAAEFRREQKATVTPHGRIDTNSVTARNERVYYSTVDGDGTRRNWSAEAYKFDENATLHKYRGLRQEP